MTRKTSLFTLLFLMALQITGVYAQTEDCYMPIRTPSAQDKKIFIEQISKYAITAEVKHGVPASAIAGMAILESGYGLTRLSQDAFNIFGYKKVAGQKVYKLTCQPAWDEGNEYVKFDSWEKAIDFVAGRLAISPYYQVDTAKYKSDLASGMDRKTAAITWLTGISSPYNYSPSDYVTKVKKCINDPFRWSEQVNETTNLWKLTPANSPIESGTNNVPQKLAKVEKIYNDLIAAGGRYMEGECTNLSPTSNGTPLEEILQPYFDNLRSQNLNLKIKDCLYQSGMKGRVIMLNVDGAQLARWTVSACQPNVTDNCLNGVIHNIWLANNAQFPITGTVAEPAEICGAGAGYVLFAFRDGVTVALKSFKPSEDRGATCTKTQLNSQQLEAVLTEPIVRTGKYVRVANVRGKEATVKDYLENARRSYLEALGKDKYELLSGWVTDNRATNQFTRLRNIPLGKLNSKCWYSPPDKIVQNCP